MILGQPSPYPLQPYGRRVRDVYAEVIEPSRSPVRANRSATVRPTFDPQADANRQYRFTTTFGVGGGSYGVEVAADRPRDLAPGLFVLGIGCIVLAAILSAT